MVVTAQKDRLRCQSLCSWSTRRKAERFAFLMINKAYMVDQQRRPPSLAVVLTCVRRKADAAKIVAVMGTIPRAGNLHYRGLTYPRAATV